jgi:hypothetical protein
MLWMQVKRIKKKASAGDETAKAKISSMMKKEVTTTELALQAEENHHEQHYLFSQA